MGERRPAARATKGASEPVRFRLYLSVSDDAIAEPREQSGGRVSRRDGVRRRPDIIENSRDPRQTERAPPERRGRFLPSCFWYFPYSLPDFLRRATPFTRKRRDDSRSTLRRPTRLIKSYKNKTRRRAETNLPCDA